MCYAAFHWLTHAWRTVADTGNTRYQECAVCKKRRAYNYAGCQPINRGWVNGAAGGPLDERPRKLPTGGSGTAPVRRFVPS